CAPQPCTNNAPRWLQGLADLVPLANGSIVRLYLLGGIVLLVLSALLNPNSNSLHRLYRDRLSKAFLFDPTRRLASRFGNSFGPASDPALRAFDLKPEDDFKVSELDPARAPYHLINAALNIEASKYANRRGRNADFYVFSPLFTGSRATGYVAMAEMERHATGLTAGSAMSVSGAAASSSMGSATIKPLVPTLAILNIRLGYWLFNPAAVAGALVRPAIARFIDQLYFLKELLGLLREDDGLIYLSDGGHIENLGLYELLRRRCKLIIAIDAESDPDMSFAALVKLERYARIDFGLRIDLPWAELRDASRAASEDVAKTGGRPPKEAPRGPHCALGTIYYPRKTAHEPESESTGLLLLIKSSFTGDENDYVVDYKRRYPRFPHETTLDQLFTEEQFEVYRALGFHAANAAFKGDDVVSMGGEPAKWQRENAAHPREILLRRILGLPLKAPPAPKG
ncbi:MAG: cell division protein, partial [Alphaproteobacteria bacterium]|nr:cell division protein [Alphaproteobacteria bacterium]